MVLQQIHRYPKVETLFFEAHVGDNTETRLRSCILSRLPCNTGDPRAVLDSRQAMKTLGDGKLFAFCGAGVRAPWSTVAAFPQALGEGKCPAWEQASIEEATTQYLRGAAAAAMHLMTDFSTRKAADNEVKLAYGELSN